MSREPTVYDETAERFLAVESALEATATSPAPIEGTVYDATLVSPAVLPIGVRRRLAEELSTLRLQDAASATRVEQAAGSRPTRTEPSAFPRPVVTAADSESTAWADELLAVLPDRLVALTVVDPAVDVEFLPGEVERDELAEALGHQPVVTAFVFPETTELTDQLGLPTLSGLFDVVDAESVTELNQRIVPLKPLDSSTAFVHTHENRDLEGVDFAVERAAFEAGNIVIEDGVCRIDPELRDRLECIHNSQRATNELLFGGLLATVGALPVVNMLIQSTLTSSGLVSPLLFGVAVVCMALALASMGAKQRVLESLAATPS